MAYGRTRDSTTVKSLPWQDNEFWNGNPVGTYSGTAAFLQQKIMHDTVSGGFSRRSSRGEIIVNSMIKHEVEVEPGSGRTAWVTQTNRYDADPVTHAAAGHSLLGTVCLIDGQKNLFLAGDDSLDDLARHEALAITKAYGEVGKADLELLTELAELKETLAFLWSPVKGMVNLTRRFRNHLSRIERMDNSYAKALERWSRRNPKHRGPEPKRPVYPPFQVGKMTGRDIASAWLAYRYGLMPLIYSFQDGQKLFETLNQNPTRATARGKETFEMSLNATSPDRNVSYGGATFRDSFTRSGSMSITCRAGVLYEPDWSLNRRLGLQMHRVPSTMYEVIPLSFVTDWFHNGLDVYNALTAELRAMKILGAWVVSTGEYDYTVTYNQAVVSGNGSTTGSTSPTRYKGKWQRRRLTSLADVRFKFRLEMNGKRIADALALIHNFLVTAKKPR